MVKEKQNYYKSTTISPERSKADIDKLLKDFDIKTRAWITKDNEDVLIFEWQVNVNGISKNINFELRPPEIREMKRVWNQRASRTEKISVRNDAVAYRLLFNYIKNKLEAVRVGMVTVENEFMSHIKFSLRDGTSTTLGQSFAGLMSNNNLQNALEYQQPEIEKTQLKMVN